MDDPAVPSVPVLNEPPLPPPSQEPFFVPPKPDMDSIPPLPPGTPLPIEPPPQKRKPMKSILLGLFLVMVLVGGALGFYFFQIGKTSFNLEKKAVGCEGAYKVCGLVTGGYCNATSDCACFTDFNTCTYADWSCCSTQEPSQAPLSPYPTSDVPPTCSITLTKEGGDGVCLKADGAQVTARACLNAVDCVNGSRSLTYQRTVAYCGGTSCEGTCGNTPQTVTLTVPSGQLCVTDTVGCTVENLCGNCQVDIGDYGERAWQDSGCTTPPTPTPTPTLTPIPSITPTPTLTPTPTVTPIPAACQAVLVNLPAGRTISNLLAGDLVSFTASFSALNANEVQDVAVDLRKGGVSVKKFFAGGAVVSPWTTPSYTITSSGSYEVVAFIKVNGVWK